MALKLIKKWIEDTFEPDSKPTVNTVKNWIRRGQIHGEIIAGRHYVVVDENGQNVISEAKPQRVKVRLT